MFREEPVLAWLLGAVLVAGPLLAQGDPSALRINEILTSNRSTTPPDLDQEFEDMIEIYNPTDSQISLKDLLLADRVEKDEAGKIRPAPHRPGAGMALSPWKIPAGSILPKGFVLIFCDGDGRVRGVGEAHASFRLEQDGEVIALFKPDGELIDLVEFPRLAPGTSYGRSPDGAGSFCHMPAPTFRQRSILLGGSLVAQNKTCGNIPPEINLRSFETIENAFSVAPAAGAPLLLVADTWDEKEDGILGAQILYQVNGGAEMAVPLVRDSYLTRIDYLKPAPPPPAPLPTVEDRTRSKWKAEIPGQPAGSVVTFTLRAEDEARVSGSDPQVPCAGQQPQAGCQPPFRYRVGREFRGPLSINEVVPLNFKIIRDTTDFQYDDYIEICSAEDALLEGLWLSNSPFRPEGWQFPAGSKIKAGEHLIIWCDNDPRDTSVAGGQYHANFNLDSAGEGVFLFDTQANGLGLIDGHEFGLTEEDIAWSRIPDCNRSADFKGVKDGSPGRPNEVVKEVKFIRGDADLNGGIDLTDAIVVLIHLFSGGEAPSCLDAADADDGGGVDITDPIWVLSYLFLNGPPPKSPFPEPGADTTEDGLGCGNLLIVP